jgi:hypothetical protein
MSRFGMLGLAGVETARYPDAAASGSRFWGSLPPEACG